MRKFAHNVDFKPRGYSGTIVSCTVHTTKKRYINGEMGGRKLLHGSKL